MTTKIILKNKKTGAKVILVKKKNPPKTKGSKYA